MKHDDVKPAVLIVDDDVGSRLAITSALADESVDLVEAASGREALRQVLDRDFAAIIMDVRMPGMDGVETARLIREHPRAGTMPVIFHTSTDADVALASRAYSVGAVDYLQKPAAPDVLRAKVAMFVRLWRERKTVERQAQELTAVNARLTIEMTEREKAEHALDVSCQRLSDANRDLDAFSHSVAHDLKAPLRHVMGFAKLLQTHAGVGLDERTRGHLRNITSAAAQMDRLVDDLLAFSRAGRAAMARERWRMDEAVAEARRRLDEEAAGRDVVWEVAEMPEICGDRALLTQVWVNLLGNALKFTRLKSPARIEVGYRRDGADDVFFVRDNGAGFDMTYADRLFGVFQRLHAVTEFEGTGIGLANVRQIVNRHGGRTWAEGVVDGGATFYFSLPAEP